MDYIEKQIKEW